MDLLACAEVLCELAPVEVLVAVRSTCRAARTHFDQADVQFYVAQRYATEVLGDAHFWWHAIARPLRTSRPLKSWYAEIARIEEFKRAINASLTASDFYRMWKGIDGPFIRNEPICAPA